jgi:hypothetical protein
VLVGWVLLVILIVQNERNMAVTEDQRGGEKRSGHV